MNPDLARVVTVVLITAAALGAAGWLRTRAGRRGEPIDVSGLAEGPAVVIFTKDDCATCAAALELVAGLGLPVRQVRAEDEPEVFEERGVAGVPLTVVIDRDGNRRGQFGGAPAGGPLARAARRAR